MSIVAVCVAFLSTILGLAYPLLLQTISNFENRYSSKTLVPIFRQQKRVGFFVISLYVTLSFLLIYLITTLNFWGCSPVIATLRNYLPAIIGLSTTVLVLAFFLFVNRVLTFYSRERLIKYLKDQNDKYIRQKTES